MDGRSQSHDVPPSTADGGVVIVLTPAGSERVAVQALTHERHWQVRAVIDPMMAIAEIAIAESEMATRKAWEMDRHDDESESIESNEGPQGSVSFVLAHPSRWPMRRGLLEAITEYFPTTRLFAFDERGLREAKRNRKRDAEGRERRRMAKPDSEPQPAESSSASEAPVVSTVSREEIDMLLGGERM